MRLDIDQDVLADTSDPIQLIVDTHSFYLPRRLLCFHSQLFTALLQDSNALLFTEFHDIVDTFAACVSLLNGEEVDVTPQNAEAFLKLCVMHKVNALYTKMLEWMEAGLSDSASEHSLSFLQVYKFGICARKMDKERWEILEICRERLRCFGLFVVKTELSGMQHLEICDREFITFLIEPTYISYTLSFVQRITISRETAEWIIESFNNSTILSVLKSNLFMEYFLSNLRSLLLSSERKYLISVISIQDKIMSTMSRRQKHNPFDCFLYSLSSDDPTTKCWLSYTSDKILRLKRQFKLTDFVFAEMAMSWVVVHDSNPGKKSQFVQQVWNQIEMKNLSKGYMFDLKANLEYICDVPLQLPNDYPPTFGVFDGYGFHLTEHESHALCHGHPIVLKHFCRIHGCEKSMESEHGVSLQLVDKMPCYTHNPGTIPAKYHQHDNVVHWWLSVPGTRDTACMVSLVTNTMKEICNILREESRVFICCMLDTHNIRDHLDSDHFQVL